MSGPTPAFSVLLSAYNEEALVGEAIASVLAQTVADFELIVVDDGSRDATAEQVKRFSSDPRLRLIEQENRGLAPSLNIAAAAATAPRLALIDADDLWFPGFLEAMGDALDAHPAAAFAYTDAWWMQMDSGRFFRRSVSEYIGAPEHAIDDPHEMLLSLLRGNWVFGLTAIDRAAFEAVGGFDESLAACEDYELWLRLLASGRAAARAPGRLAVQRDRGDSMSSDTASMLDNLAAVYRILAADAQAPEDARALARVQEAAMHDELRALDSGGGWIAMRRALRARAGRARKALTPGLVWHRGVPEQVGQAFPEVQFGARSGR